MLQASGELDRAALRALIFQAPTFDRNEVDLLRNFFNNIFTNVFKFWFGGDAIIFADAIGEEPHSSFINRKSSPFAHLHTP